MEKKIIFLRYQHNNFTFFYELKIPKVYNANDIAKKLRIDELVLLDDEKDRIFNRNPVYDIKTEKKKTPEEMIKCLVAFERKRQTYIGGFNK